MTRIRIFLKNGMVLPDIECEHFTLKRSNITGEITGYEYKGANYPAPLHIDPSAIVAVYQMTAHKKETAKESSRCPFGFDDGCGEMKNTAGQPEAARYTAYACQHHLDNYNLIIACPLWPHKEENANG